MFFHGKLPHVVSLRNVLGMRGLTTREVRKCAVEGLEKRKSTDFVLWKLADFPFTEERFYIVMEKQDGSPRSVYGDCCLACCVYFREGENRIGSFSPFASMTIAFAHVRYLNKW